MLVEQFLVDKTNVLITARGDESFQSAANRLTKNEIGVLLVEDDDKTLIGILSERDLVHKISERASAALDLMVSDIMTPDPIVCDLDDTLDQVMTIMTKHRIRHVPVVCSGILCGILSQRDVLAVAFDRFRRQVCEVHEAQSVALD